MFIRVLLIIIVLIIPSDSDAFFKKKRFKKFFSTFKDTIVDIGATLTGGLINNNMKVYKPFQMYTSEGFFNPEIIVIKTFTKEKRTFGIDDKCSYVVPSRICPVSAKCNGDYEKPDFIDGQYDCICAKQSFKFTSGAVNDRYIGCFVIPYSPGPSAFCDNVGLKIQSSIVPVKDSSFFNPKIKVVVGHLDKKMCDNGTFVNLNLECGDGSTGRKAFVSSIFPVKKNETTSSTIRFKGKDYDIKLESYGDEVCASFESEAGLEFGSMLSQCYELPSLSKPKNLKLVRRDNLSFTLDENGSQKIVLGVGDVHAATGLNVEKLLLGPDNDVLYSLNCINEEDGSVAGINFAEGGSLSCDDGYELTVDLEKSDDSNLLCIKGWKPEPFESVLAGNAEHPKVGIIESKKARFIEYEFSSGGMQESGNKYKIDNFTQEQLDSIKRYDKSIISMNDEIKGKRYFKYRTQDQDIEKVNTIFGNTIELSEEEKLNEWFSYIYPKSPFVHGLCVVNDDSGYEDEYFEETFFSYQENEIFYEIPAYCDFIKIKAWGGGGAGYLGQEIHRTFSGSSGAYSVATYLTNDTLEDEEDRQEDELRSHVRIKIGKGSDDFLIDSGDTKVDLCKMKDDTKEYYDCIDFLTAKGARANGIPGEASKWDYSLDFILNPESISGISGMNASVQKPIPLVPFPSTGSLLYSRDDRGYFDNGICSNFDLEEYKANISASEESNNDESVQEVDVEESELSSDIENEEEEDKVNLDRSSVAGSGGCVLHEEKIIQPGANGAVIISCEKVIRESS